MGKQDDVPQDVAAVVGEAEALHADLANRVRSSLIGRSVIVKTKVNGIANRPGVIRDTILTYRVSLGIDLFRLDGRSGYLDRLWFGVHLVEFVGGEG